jgi:hypothetical protein
MPRLNRVRGHDARHLGKQFSANRFTLHRQFPPLIVGESQPPPFELRLEHLVFGLEILDHCLLLAAYPAGENHH